MLGNWLVRFLGEGAAAMSPPYPTKAFRKHGRKSVPNGEILFLEGKGTVPFFNIKWVSLAKFRDFEVDFAHNPGTVPPSNGGGFPFVSC